MVSVTPNGTIGSDRCRSWMGCATSGNNVQNTIHSFAISGYSGNYPELHSELSGAGAWVCVLARDARLTLAAGSLTTINYGTESSAGTVRQFQCDRLRRRWR